MQYNIPQKPMKVGWTYGQSKSLNFISNGLYWLYYETLLCTKEVLLGLIYCFVAHINEKTFGGSEEVNWIYI